MPGRPFQGARIRLAAGSALRAAPWRFGRAAHQAGRTEPAPILKPDEAAPPKKKQPRGRARLENRSSPSAQGSGSKRAHAIFSSSDAQKRVCGGIAARSRRCGGAASQLYDQFRPYFAINRLRRKRHKPQRGSPNRRTGRGIFPAAPFEPIIAQRGAREHSPRPGPIPPRPDPSSRSSRKSHPTLSSLGLKGGGPARLDSLRSKRPNSQTPAAQSARAFQRRKEQSNLRKRKGKKKQKGKQRPTQSLKAKEKRGNMREVLISKNTMESWRNCFSCCCVAQARRKAIRTFNGRRRVFLLIFQHRRKQLRQERLQRFSHAFPEKNEHRGGDFGRGGWARQQTRAIDSEGPSHAWMLETRIEKQNLGCRQNERAAFPTEPRKAKDGWLRRAKRNRPHRPPRPPTPGRRLAARCFANARPDARKSSAGREKGRMRGKSKKGERREDKRQKFLGMYARSVDIKKHHEVMAQLLLRLSRCASSKKSNPDLQWSLVRLSFYFSTQAQNTPTGEGINTFR